jgi:hypothetical protein
VPGPQRAQDPRGNLCAEPGKNPPERADLLAELASARSALIGTTRGLSDEHAGERPTVSALCLGGLIKHVASIEEGWMRFVVDGPVVERYEQVAPRSKQVIATVLDTQAGSRIGLVTLDKTPA